MYSPLIHGCLAGCLNGGLAGAGAIFGGVVGAFQIGEDFRDAKFREQRAFMCATWGGFFGAWASPSNRPPRSRAGLGLALALGGALGGAGTASVINLLYEFRVL